MATTSPTARATNVHWHEGTVTRNDRLVSMGQKGCTLWMTGLSASGKSTIAVALEKNLVMRGFKVYRLDGDNIRHGLNKDLGFSDTDRAENIRRIGEVAKLMADAGLIVISSFISPYKKGREYVREKHNQDSLHFAEVYVNCSVAVAEGRDPKGLYKKARAGELKGFTGIDDPFEEPEKAEIELKTGEQTVPECVETMISYLEKNDILNKDPAKKDNAPRD
eukprot:GHVL01003557.1.p1 GENE.GHVL01003557.1~~GHVL01003557.1.p1  ORF type:complete len:221 (+),score=32.75 GHVL01003557.1:54-716(+)